MKNQFENLLNDQNITTIKYQAKYQAYCTIGKEPFTGVIYIIFDPDKKLLEFESFDRWIAGFNKLKTTIEKLTWIIYGELKSTLEPKNLYVRVTAKTVVHNPAEAIISDYGKEIS
ncbi:MAG: hypothetical protein WC341_00640 [Bacteroidales bacterium]|jgi:NADPH-dependent 7-cyano-7-deazaguanine reductase QueF